MADPRLQEFLANVKLAGRPGALLGEPGVSVETLLRTSWPDSRVVHLDCTFGRPVEELEELFRQGLQPRSAFLLTLTDWAHLRVFQLLEQLLSEGQIELNGASLKAAPDSRLVVHSRSGLFPYYELIPLRLAV